MTLGIVLTFGFKVTNFILNKIQKPEIDIDADLKAVIMAIGFIILIANVFIIPVSYHTNKGTIAEYNTDPCGWGMNETIMTHREFHQDIFFGVYYSSDVANLKLCRSR